MPRLNLRDPEACPRCGGESYVVESRHTPTYRWRRRRCLVVCCVNPEDGQRTVWRTYESLINPEGIHLKRASS